MGNIPSGYGRVPRTFQVHGAAEAATAMAQSTQRDLSELVSLVADLTGVALTEVQNLCAVGDALRRASGSSRAPVPSHVIAQLQESFRRLTQCVFLVRREIDRLQTITRTELGARP